MRHIKAGVLPVVLSWVIANLIAPQLYASAQTMQPAETSLESPVAITVTDPTGAPIAGAEIKTIPSSSSFPLTADTEGKLTVLLTPGSYRLTIYSPGFARWTKQIDVHNGSNPSVPAILTVGTGGGPIVTADNAGPELILFHGTILTGEGLKEEHPQVVSAMAIAEGKVVAVGTDDAIKQLAGPQTTLRDLGGAYVMAGLNDAHVHLGGAGQTKLNVDLTGATSLKEMLQRIQSKAEQSPAGHWLTGGGWDHTLWTDKTLPSRQDLDRGTGNHPTLLERIDGHIAVANTAALTAAKITGKTKAPQGGAIDLDVHGQPTGILRDTEMEAVEQLIPPPTHEERRRGLELAIEDAVSHGLTSVQDNSDWQDFLVFEELEKEGKLGLRITEWLPFDAPIATLKEHRTHHDLDDPMLHTGMLKGFMDGSLGSRTAAMKAPYADEPGNSGLARYDQAKLNAMAAERAKAGFQIGFHAIGDKAAAMALDAFSQPYNVCFEPQPAGTKCSYAVSENKRDRIEHAQVVDPADIQRFAQLGVIASMQPNHLLTDMNWAEDRLGPRRAAYSYAWKAYLDAGVVVAFGTDYPVEPVTPFRGLYAAVTRMNEAGTKTYFPENKLTRGQALYAYTQGSAYAEFDEKHKGKLAAGYDADYVILDRNLLTCPAAEILKTQVVETVVAGKSVYKAHP